MTRRTVFSAALVLLALGIAGHVAYEYVKEKPPSWLAEIATWQSAPPPLPEGVSAPLDVPAGFTATIFARDLAGARVLIRDPKGVLLLSQTSEGKVVALPDLDGDGQADTTVTVLEGLDRPHGLSVHCPDTGFGSVDQDACELYVAETDGITAYRYDADTYAARDPRKIVSLPAGGGHYTRTLLPHPDGERLLVSVGSSCNVCIETDARRATVQALNLATGALAPFATGLRNTVFMAVHPVSGEVWGTDNGRDLIGDDVPPDEVNVIRDGQDYGWPYCYGQNVYDADFGREDASSCGVKAPARIDLPAHAAALGIDFVPEEGWPEEYWHDAVIALHGSWNRSEPAGYKVVRVDLTPDGVPAGGIADFVTGFLPDGARDTDDAIGRPVDVLVEPGGVMYVSDDRAGAVYRIALTEPPR